SSDLGESGEGIKLQLPGHSHQGGPFLDQKHHCTAEKGTTEAVFPEVTREVQIKKETVSVLLPLLCGVSAKLWHLAVVCQLHGSRKKGTPEGHYHSATRNWLLFST